MNLDAMEVIYLVCFFLGLGFAVISGLLSGVFSGGAEAHADVGGHPGDGSVHFSPLSPVTLAMFIATFGGSGYIFKNLLHWPMLAHVSAAAASGFVVAGLVFYLFYKVFSATQSSSEARAADVIGQDAEVTVSIPNNGLGEIAYTVGGTRYTNPARTLDGKELPAHAQVKVVKMVGSTYVVQKSQ